MTSAMSKKLQIKAGQRGALLNVAANYQAVLDPLPDGADLVGLTNDKLDFVLLFVQDSQELKQWEETAVSALKSGGLLWIAYPKKSSGIKTDMTRDKGWAALYDKGLRPIRQIAVDDTWSALRFRPAESEEEAIAKQYAGAKAKFKPIYDHLIQFAQRLGPDVTLATRKTYVALVRDKQFAVIVPSTKTRLDLGLKFKDKPFTEQLTPAKNLGSGSITHKVALTALEDADETILDWLREAYEAAG